MYTEDSGEIVDSTEGDSQCPTCGSVVMADDITLPSAFREYITGFLCGITGALACVAVLYFGGCIQFAV